MVKVMSHGRLVRAHPSLNKIQDTAVKDVGRLPARFKGLGSSEQPPVRLSQRLRELSESLWSNVQETAK